MCCKLFEYYNQLTFQNAVKICEVKTKVAKITFI